MTARTYTEATKTPGVLKVWVYLPYTNTPFTGYMCEKTHKIYGSEEAAEIAGKSSNFEEVMRKVFKGHAFLDEIVKN